MFAAQITLAYEVSGTWELPFFWFVFSTQAAIAFISARFVDESLIKERFLPPRNADRDLLGPLILGVLYPLHLLIAAADISWWHYSDTVPFFVQLPALILVAAGWIGFMWTMSTNKFFSSVVRLQHDRGHEVVTDGPYRYVRHPGYLFLTVALISQAIALGSLLSCVPILLIVIHLIHRTTIEEHLLEEALPGYKQYMSEVTFRWVPHLW